jgi:hypothetical protein
VAFLKKHWLAILVVLGALVFLALEPSRNLVVSILGGGAGILLFLSNLLGGGKVHGNGSGAEQVKQGLADSSKLVDGLASGERQTQEGLDRQAKDLGTASGAIADDISVLSEIAKRGPDKPS